MLRVNAAHGGLLHRNPRRLLNDVQPRVKHLTINVLDRGMALWPEVRRGVGRLVDLGVHQLILDTPAWWALCDTYNGGRYQHHAPFIERRNDGLCLRTAEFLASIGFDVDEELWAIDGTDCSPCDNKVPDRH
ncbi:hypothetical protein ACIP6P_10145 [Streptomyces sp. NPDC088729]|uniref:hypothetical protein n=1 Tax=Streptomyces sp. NPDC088729 TaxID=3365876 RepID=UPI0037F9F16C